jgi:type I restriction enzyme M protein
MGYIFEELLRKFSEMSNETAGEHYTPREVIRLMVNILFSEDSKALTGTKPIRSLYDPACGTGGMLSISEEYLKQINPSIELNVFGQELNAETWAMCRSDLMIKGQDPKRIAYGNSLTDEDGHSGLTFDYCISNPPYGVDWKKYQEKIVRESEKLGFDGRYGAGLPRIDDGSFLFVQHMISKMKPAVIGNDGEISGGSRVAIILGGGTLFSGAPGSGDSNIRKWLVENDLVEGIIALPDKMFYNTEIGTYLWVLTNRKPKSLKDKIKLVDARSYGSPMRKPLGDKRKMLLDEEIEEITRIYVEKDSKSPNFKLQTCEDFGYARFQIQRPQLDEKGKPVVDKKGQIKPNLDLKDFENLPLPDGYLSLSLSQKEAALIQIGDQYLSTVIKPRHPDAWVDQARTKISYEIPIWKLFFVYEPPQPVSKLIIPIEGELKKLAEDLNALAGDLK